VTPEVIAAQVLQQTTNRLRAIGKQLLNVSANLDGYRLRQEATEAHRNREPRLLSDGLR